MGEKYDKKLVPNEWGKKYIPEIFHRVIKGDSVQVIARWLTDEGVPAGAEKKDESNGWWPRVVQRIVQNPVYIGFYNMEYYDANTDSRVKAVHLCERLLTVVCSNGRMRHSSTGESAALPMRKVTRC